MEILIGFSSGMMIAIPYCLKIGFFENVLRIFYCLQIIEVPINWSLWVAGLIKTCLTCGCK